MAHGDDDVPEAREIRLSVLQVIGDTMWDPADLATV